MISTTTLKSWFPDVTADALGRAYFVWHSERREGQDLLDLLMYTAWTGASYQMPNDIVFPGVGGFTVRPSIAADDQNRLHMVYRDGTDLYYTQAPADTAHSAATWQTPRLISNMRSAYYSDIAVDSAGVIHVVWNEQPLYVPVDPAVWIGTGAAILHTAGETARSCDPPLDVDAYVVYAIEEDGSGFDWFATSAGLLRYDGVAWERVRLGEADADVPVLAIAQDVDGTLWFCTADRLFHYESIESGDARWTELPFPPQLAEAAASVLAVDVIGHVWLGTPEGLGQYDGQTWRIHMARDGLWRSAVSSVAGAYDGRLWVGTDAGLFERVGAAWVRVAGSEGLAVTALAWDPEAAVLWVGARSGLWRYDGSLWQVDDGPDSAVAALALDGAGRLWVGTSAGVDCFEEERWAHYPLGDGPVTALAADNTPNAMCPLCMDVYYRRSEDGGASWSAPYNLSQSFAGSVKPQLTVDAAGRVYVVWEEGEDWYIGEGYPVGAVYRRSLDGGATWEAPFTFTHPDGAPQQVTLGVGRGGQLVAVWRLPLSLPERSPVYYQLSDDGGASWSAPTPIPTLIAKDWLPMSLDACHAVSDSAGNVHLLVLGYLDPLEEQLSLVYTSWNGEQWSEPTRLFTSSDPPEWPRLAVGMGNRLHATWFVRDAAHIWDSERGRYQVWAAQLETSAPRVVPEATLTPLSATSTEALTPVAPSLAETSLPALDGSMPPQGIYTDSDDALRIAAALSPVLVLLAGLLVARSLQKARRR